MGERWLAAARAAHTRALGAPQAFALTGDGDATARVRMARHTEDARGGSDGYAGPELAAARYRDWLVQQRTGAVETRAYADTPAPGLTLTAETAGAVQVRLTMAPRQTRDYAPLAAQLAEAKAHLRALVEEFGELFPDECAAAAAFLAFPD